MSPSNYSRPKTALNYKRVRSSEKYSGGLFKAEIDFKNQADKQIDKSLHQNYH